MKKLLAILSVLCCTAASALAQTTITLPIAANAVADIGNGPIKVRMIAGNASIFTSQGSGVGSTSGASTALTLTATPATPPIVGGLISGSGIISGTTVSAYNGTTGITLSAAMTVAGGTAVAWGAACPSMPPSNVIQASPQADYYVMYTQARVCAVSPGGPVNTLLIDPIFYDQTTPNIGAGVDQNILRSVTGNDTVLTADCGKTLQLTTGFFTETLPSVAGFDPVCKVTITNGDATRAKALSGFPTNVAVFLWPKQTVVVEIVNGAWIVNDAPGRWKLTGAVTLNIDSSVGSDSNDCLTAGTGGACLTWASATGRWLGQWDQSGQTVTFQAATGQTWTSISIPNQVFRGSVVVDGGGGTFTTTTGLPAIQINGNRALGTVFLQNVTITCSGGGSGVNVIGGIAVTQAGITYGACPGGYHRIVANGGEMTASGNYTISGGALAHLYADSQSLQDDFQAITVTCTGTPAFSQAFAVAVLNATTYSGGVTFTGNNTGAGCGLVTGNRYTAQTNGFVSSVGGGAHYFPGNSEGFVSTGGHYDTPGTPAISSCGTSPTAATGTDTSGNVTEGTIATGCVITFTTANHPNACSVNTSSATAQAGLTYVLSPTALTVTHPSVSNAVLYWTCPPN